MIVKLYKICFFTFFKLIEPYECKMIQDMFFFTVFKLIKLYECKMIQDIFFFSDIFLFVFRQGIFLFYYLNF